MLSRPRRIRARLLLRGCITAHNWRLEAGCHLQFTDWRAEGEDGGICCAVWSV